MPGLDSIHPQVLKEFKWKIDTISDHLEETTMKNRVNKHKDKYVVAEELMGFLLKEVMFHRLLQLCKGVRERSRCYHLL